MSERAFQTGRQKKMDADPPAAQTGLPVEERFRRLLNATEDVVFTLDCQQRHTGVYGSWVEKSGLTAAHFLGKSARDLYGEAAAVHEDANRRALAGEYVIYDWSVPGPAGQLFYQTSLSPLYDENGQVTGLVGIGRNVTQQRLAELRIRYLMRLYATLSQVNQAIVRASDRQTLFDTICRIAIDYGQFCLAWIGVLEESGHIRPAAIHGLAGSALPSVNFNLRELPFKEGILGLAVRSGQIQFSNDIQVDPRMSHWSEAALQGNYHSAAAIPLRQDGVVIGILNLCAPDIDFFTAEEEQSLLAEIGLDISFALDNLQRKLEHEQAEKTLRQWADAFEHCAHGIAIGIPVSNRMLTCNPAFARLQGRTIEEIASMPILGMYAPESHATVKQHIGEADRTGSARFEARMIRKDGSTYPVQMDLVSVRDEAGNILYRVATQQDISERSQAEEQIKNSLAEKETLLSELYHRTKNNMAVIIALLGLQSDYFEDERLKKALLEAQNRVRAMALVHQKLYDAQDLSRINLKDYMDDLVPLILRGLNISSPGLSVTLETQDVHALIDTAIPCGLILNELLSNAIKHAFPDGQAGEIKIRLQPTASGEIELSVSDNGVGLPPGFDVRRDGSLGLQTIVSLGEGQLQGQVTFESQGGLTCRLTFQDIFYQPRV